MTIEQVLINLWNSMCNFNGSQLSIQFSARVKEQIMQFYNTGMYNNNFPQIAETIGFGMLDKEYQQRGTLDPRLASYRTAYASLMGQTQQQPQAMVMGQQPGMAMGIAQQPQMPMGIMQQPMNMSMQAPSMAMVQPQINQNPMLSPQWAPQQPPAMSLGQQPMSSSQWHGEQFVANPTPQARVLHNATFTAPDGSETLLNKSGHIIEKLITTVEQLPGHKVQVDQPTRGQATVVELAEPRDVVQLEESDEEYDSLEAMVKDVYKLTEGMYSYKRNTKVVVGTTGSNKESVSPKILEKIDDVLQLCDFKHSRSELWRLKKEWSDDNAMPGSTTWFAWLDSKVQQHAEISMRYRYDKSVKTPMCLLDTNMSEALDKWLDEVNLAGDLYAVCAAMLSGIRIIKNTDTSANDGYESIYIKEHVPVLYVNGILRSSLFTNAALYYPNVSSKSNDINAYLDAAFDSQPSRCLWVKIIDCTGIVFTAYRYGSKLSQGNNYSIVKDV